MNQNNPIVILDTIQKGINDIQPDQKITQPQFKQFPFQNQQFDINFKNRRDAQHSQSILEVPQNKIQTGITPSLGKQQIVFNPNLQAQFQLNQEKFQPHLNKNYLQKQNQEFQENLKQQQITLEMKNRELEEKEKTYQNQLQNLDEKNSQLQQQLNILEQNNQQYVQQLQKYNYLADEITILKKNNVEQQSAIKSKDDIIQQLNQQIQVLKSQQNVKSQEAQNQENLYQQLDKLQQMNLDLVQENKELLKQKLQYENQFKDLETQYIILQNESNMYKIKAGHLENETQQLIQKIQELYGQRDQAVIITSAQEYITKFKKNQEKIQQEQEEQLRLEKQRIQQNKLQEQQNQMLLNDIGRQKISELVRKAGQIQCCFVMDIQRSDEKFANIIINATQICGKSIKKMTNRDSSWGAICYAYMNDKLEIAQQKFTESSETVSKFLKSLPLNSDIKDQPEDLKSALLAMLKFDWSEKYKLAVIIPNSPCHGKKYHHPKKYKQFLFFTRDYDKKPQDELEDVIEKMIQKQIIMLVIRYNEQTKVMCNELEKLYKKLNHPECFHTLSLQKVNQQISEEELNKQIQIFIAFIIGINNKMTRTKLNYNQRLQNFELSQIDMKNLKNDMVILNNEIKQENLKGDTQQHGDISINQFQNAIEDQNIHEKAVQRVMENRDGPLQALCKKGEISNFELQVQCEQFSCKVYTVELSQQAFQNKIIKIQNLNTNDFIINLQNNWQCIRTKQPFAYGMMKEVYLMKKQNINEEIYVVKIPINKGPYIKIEEAIKDCRSHLIAKELMKEFMQKIRESNPQIQNVQYTDFLLLEENKNKYWIAERFFKGVFEKYNNNDGYISQAQTELNSISQAFSYFTYSRSEFNYIINDVQGVGRYFTDPAINTIGGNFDETDSGEEGMSNFFCSFKQKQQNYEQLLNSIGLVIE